ncbi:MAG TPA: hypothetical protein VET26_03160, partial [Candidatus Sulfotelmatobacter sp.]|nr:hypothetical protein [Candidatus Sulfotelmatobacter sp.]
MIRRAAALVVPLLLVALTVGIGVWDLQTARSNEQQAAAAARPTPSPPPVPVIHPRQLPADFQAGVSVVVYGNDPYFQLKARALLDRLARLGVNSLSLVIPVFQQGWSASQVYVDPVRTPSDARIAVFATEAHRRGFTLMLRPLLDIVVAQDGSHWRGSIQPPDPVRWKQTYAAILMNYARLAQANRVDSLD